MKKNVKVSKSNFDNQIQDKFYSLSITEMLHIRGGSKSEPEPISPLK
jgi:hypothetical protein